MIDPLLVERLIEKIPNSDCSGLTNCSGPLICSGLTNLDTKIAL